VIYPGIARVFLEPIPRTGRLLSRLDLHEQSFFLVVSTLEPRKNLRTVIAAFAGLASEQRQRMPLVIVGAAGWGGLDLPREWETLKREGALRFLGYLPNDELAQLYASARRFLYPSFYEGFGMPITEALACGARVICSQAASMPEAGGAVAEMVHPLDVNIWRERMSAAFDEVSTPANASLRSDHLRKFTWEAAAEQTLAMYGELP
jgi:alpha-1,3-rhamnosyl/mannosyltransferase